MRLCILVDWVKIYGYRNNRGEFYFSIVFNRYILLGCFYKFIFINECSLIILLRKFFFYSGWLLILRFIIGKDVENSSLNDIYF